MGVTATKEQSDASSVTFRLADDGGGGTQVVDLSFLSTGFTPIPTALQQAFRPKLTDADANAAMIGLDVLIYPATANVAMLGITIGATAATPALNFIGPGASAGYRIRIRKLNTSAR